MNNEINSRTNTRANNGTIFLGILLIVSVAVIICLTCDYSINLGEKDDTIAQNEVLTSDLNNLSDSLIESNANLYLDVLTANEKVSELNGEVFDLELENDYKDLRIEELEAEKKEMMELLGYDMDGIITQGDITILERIVEAEATNCSFEAKRNVAFCVLNRVGSNNFPDSIESVVFQKVNNNYSFSPLTDGRYYEVNVTEQTQSAVRDALNGIGSHNATYFMNRGLADKENSTWFDRNLKWLFKDDSGHEYFRGEK